MKNFKKYILDNIIYLINIICSIYLSYLLTRVFEINNEGIIFLYLLIISLGIFYSKLIKKTINLKKIKEEFKPKLIIISCFFTIIILGLNYNFFTFQYTNTSLEINTKTKTLEEAINKIYINNVPCYIENNKCKNTYPEFNSKTVKISKNENNNYTLNFKKALNIRIEFNEINESLTLKEKDNEQIETTFYKDNNLYTLKTNKTSDCFNLVRIILSFSMIFFETVMLLIVLKATENKSKKSFLITLLLTFLIGILYINFYQLGIITFDSKSYINFDFESFFDLTFSGRTPIYSMIISFCTFLFGKERILFICLLQYAIWYISIIYLYKTLQLLLKNNKIITIIVILYALCPAVITWNNLILTESLALSGTIFFIYNIIKYIKSNNTKNGILAIIISLILTFHRPTSIIYMVFLLIFWITRFIFDRKNIKKDIKCFFISIVSLVVVVIYAIIFHKTFGIYSISDAVVRQDLFVIMNEGFYKTYEDPQFKQYVEDGIKKHPEDFWLAVWDVMPHYSLNEVKQITNKCKIQNLKGYIKYLIRITEEQASIKYSGYSLGTVNKKFINYTNAIDSTFNIINFAICYIILLIEFVIILVEWIKSKNVPWIHCGLFGFPLVIIGSSFIGTNAEFMRTSLCVLPFMYISISLLLEHLSKSNLKQER